MECSLCGFENPAAAQRCQLCEAELTVEEPTVQEPVEPLAAPEHVHLGVEDISRSRPAWLPILAGLGLLVCAALSWWSVSDLFETPADVKQSILAYQDLKQRYLQDRDHWIARKDQVTNLMQRHYWDQDISKPSLHFDDLPLEILMAFLDDDLNLLRHQDPNFSLYPYEESSELRFLLTKTDGNLWPFTGVVAVEIELELDENGLRATPTGLRRGSRLLPAQLAADSFAADFQQLSAFKNYAGGIRRLTLYEKNEAPADTPRPHISWEYQHRSFTKPQRA